MKQSTLESKDALGIIEEALSLLRRLPFLSYAGLYIGAAPFVLYALICLVNLVHNPNAGNELVGFSFVLAALYVWLRVWQTVFAAAVWRERAGAAAVKWDWPTIRRVIWTHLVYSPISLVALGLSVVVMFPLGWVYAFHQNLSLLALPGFEPAQATGVRLPYRKEASQPRNLSWEQARLWPGQNHLLMALLSLFTIVVFLNVSSLLLLLPYLLKFLVGWESLFTRLGIRFFNLTILATAVALTYLAVAPLVRTTYVLRCFYGLSLGTGADLLSELRRLRQVRTLAAVLLVALCVAASAPAGIWGQSPNSPDSAAELGELGGWPLFPAVVMAAATSQASADSGISAHSLDQSISQVLKQDKHAWRAPKEVETNKKTALQQALEEISEWLAKLLRWLRPEPGPDMDSGRGGVDVKMVSKILLVVLILAAAFLLIRALMTRSGKRPARATLTGVEPPDLSQADVSPGQLPEEGWLALAAEMVDKGESRLAIRAVYLAALAFLGEKDLVKLTRYKSNRDYAKELGRKTRGATGVYASFENMIASFERVWYGSYLADRTQFGEMRELFSTLKQQAGV